MQTIWQKILDAINDIDQATMDEMMQALWDGFVKGENPPSALPKDMGYTSVEEKDSFGVVRVTYERTQIDSSSGMLSIRPWIDRRLAMVGYNLSGEEIDRFVFAEPESR